MWIQGYWYPVQNRYVWHNGYWTQPPYQGARWVGPQYSSQQYYAGYWEGEHGRSAHDHRTDRAKERDFPGRGRQ